MKIHTADSLTKVDELDAKSIHAIVTDPPYGLAFMGRDWDDFEPQEYQEWCEEWARKAKRVLKPGGHLLAFSGNRTHHRLFSGVEDAGYEIRDTITWHYGSGFPKASDISKTIDKRANAEREVVRKKKTNTGITGDNYGQESESGTVDVTAPATDAAKTWDGFKTALKPATEYVVVARKPFDGATVDCVLEHGTGALNIDGTRIEANDGERNANPNWGSTDKYAQDEWTQDKAKERNDKDATTTEGRYPGNVLFDEVEAERLDERVGVSVSKGGSDSNPFENGGMYAEEHKRNYDATVGKGDKGGPSRYFYTSKASKSERTENGKIDNTHPTVKPVDLMEWLVTLVTKENQTVLDPFCGSGTTGKACKHKNREFIGIEKQPKWADVARVRCGLTPDDPSVVRGDDSQQGLEQF